MLQIRPLDPQTDLSLFKEAVSWRSHKKHVGAEEASFESIIANDPQQIVIGVFNGQFCAVFLLYEDTPKHFSCHMTSKRGTSRDTLIQAGILIRDTFLHNGAEELCAWITERNLALKGYLEALGFAEVERKEFPSLPKVTEIGCKDVSECPTIPADTSEPPMRMFTKYEIRGESLSDSRTSDRRQERQARLVV